MSITGRRSSPLASRLPTVPSRATKPQGPESRAAIPRPAPAGPFRHTVPFFPQAGSSRAPRAPRAGSPGLAMNAFAIAPRVRVRPAFLAAHDPTSPRPKAGVDLSLVPPALPSPGPFSGSQFGGATRASRRLRPALLLESLSPQRRRATRVERSAVRCGPDPVPGGPMFHRDDRVASAAALG